MKKCKNCNSEVDWQVIGYLNQQTNKRLIQCMRCKRVVMLKWGDTVEGEGEL